MKSPLVVAAIAMLGVYLWQRSGVSARGAQSDFSRATLPNFDRDYTNKTGAFRQFQKR